ncbi:MAG: hypothetical protein JSS60_06035 [Verrucomicrobia bacterium]|nr:hypothetical protein [Verrucomicrobiota bacterium]
MSCTPIRRAHGNPDPLAQMKHPMHLDLSASISSGNESQMNGVMIYLRTASKDWQKKYVSDGSYYEALVANMRMGEHQKVSDALEFLGRDSQFVTLEIRLCAAACFLQLGKREDCTETLNQTLVVDEEMLTALDRMIAKSSSGERAAYEKLREHIQANVSQHR